MKQQEEREKMQEDELLKLRTHKNSDRHSWCGSLLNTSNSTDSEKSKKS